MENPQTRIIPLLIMALSLTGGAVLLGLGIMLFVQHPEWLQTKKQAQVGETPVKDAPSERIQDGVDIESGLIAEDDYLLVKQTCTGCHSAQLVTQNRATAEGWTEMIRWMQATQNLWDLGDQEAKIVAYLAKYYPPRKSGRRQTLEIAEWYEIEQ